MDTWINALYFPLWSFYAYQDNMKELFNKIPNEKPTSTIEESKRKHQTLLTDIGG